AGRSQASTSNTCATISSRSSGTSSRRCRRCLTTWSRTRAANTWTRTGASPAASSTPPPSRSGTRVHRLLDQLVTQMVEKGIHYEDALREFDRRFIVEVVGKSAGNLSKAAVVLG